MIDTYLKEEIDEILVGDLPFAKKRIEVRKLKKKGLSKEHIDLFLNLLNYMNEF